MTMNKNGHLEIAIASGKGGTGKTTVAVNMALILRDMEKSVRLVDCDVEAPNAHIFMKPDISVSRRVTAAVPVVDEDKCDGCGECGHACRFSAIIALGTKAMTFPALCHACGGCMIACPQKAITEGEREIGLIEKGASHGIEFAHGRLRVGEAMSPPLIRILKKMESGAEVTILDCPPGTSCPVVQSVRGSDYVILVTEPTPFGLHDLKLAVEMVRELRLPFGVVVNRSDPKVRAARDFCLENDIRIIGEIPDDRRAAEAYSRGEMLVETLPEFKEIFRAVIGRIIEEAGAARREAVS